MPRRNFLRTAALIPERWLPERYTLNGEDTAALITIVQNGSTDDLLDVFSLCIRYGYVMGHRATLNGAYKEVKPKKGRNQI